MIRFFRVHFTGIVYTLFHHIDWWGDLSWICIQVCSFKNLEKQKKLHVWEEYQCIVMSVRLQTTYFRSRKFEKELAMIWKIEVREIQGLMQGNASTTSLFPDGNDVITLC